MKADEVKFPENAADYSKEPSCETVRATLTMKATRGLYGLYCAVITEEADPKDTHNQVHKMFHPQKGRLALAEKPFRRKGPLHDGHI